MIVCIMDNQFLIWSKHLPHMTSQMKFWYLMYTKLRY